MTPGRDLAERFQLAEEPVLQPRYNIAPTQAVAAIREDAATLTRHLALLKWGLVPFWAKDMTIGPRMINARSETVASKPAFRAAFKHRRCLIPADGFYEWKKEKARKQPFLITMADQSPFAFAGLWEHWQDPQGSVLESCTILTAGSNDLVSSIHDRMPVILRPDDYGLWLDTARAGPDLLQPLLKPYPSERMTMRAVNPKVNNASYDAPDCIEG